MLSCAVQMVADGLAVGPNRLRLLLVRHCALHLFFGHFQRHTCGDQQLLCVVCLQYLRALLGRHRTPTSSGCRWCRLALTGRAEFTRHHQHIFQCHIGVLLLDQLLALLPRRTRDGLFGRVLECGFTSLTWP